MEIRFNKSLVESHAGYAPDHFAATYGPVKDSGVTLVNNNESISNSTAFARDENLAKIEIIVQALILFLAVFGNMFVLCFLLCRRKKLSRMNTLILHLSLADLFVAFFNILPQLIWDITYRFYGDDILCRLVKYLQVVAMYASSYVLLTTALDRYLAICHPLTSHTWPLKRIHLMVLVAWTFALVFSVPQLIIFGYKEVQPGVYDCWGAFQPEWTLKLYITWITGAIYILPCLVLAVAYGRICVVVWNSMMSMEPSVRQPVTRFERCQNGTGRCVVYSAAHPGETPTGSSNPRAHVRGLSRSKMKTIKLTLTVVLCYLLCWSPFFVAQMWAAWDINAPFKGSAMTIILLLASLNSCTNPWIYMAFSGNACTEIMQAIRRHQHRRRSSRSSNNQSCYKMSLLSRTETTRLNNLNNSLAYGTGSQYMKGSDKKKGKIVDDESSAAIL